MILVDGIVAYNTKLRYKNWSHMCSDTSLEELHEFAAKLGLKKEWFQPTPYAHYDIVPTKRALAVKLGAQEVGAKEGLKRNFDYVNKKRIRDEQE